MPYIVSHALEEVLQEGNVALYVELTGLRNPPALPPANSNIIYAILLEADDEGYLHYMFFNKKTFKRSTYYLTEVKDRWIVSPEDAHFLYYSGQWVKFFLPITIVYLFIVFIVVVVIIVYHKTKHFREKIYG